MYVCVYVVVLAEGDQSVSKLMFLHQRMRHRTGASLVAGSYSGEAVGVGAGQWVGVSGVFMVNVHTYYVCTYVFYSMYVSVGQVCEFWCEVPLPIQPIVRVRLLLGLLQPPETTGAVQCCEPLLKTCHYFHACCIAPLIFTGCECVHV